MRKKLKIGYIGLGKMGLGMVELLIKKGSEVVAFDIEQDSVRKARDIGAISAYTIEELAEKLPAPRVIWLMVPNSAVASVVDKLLPLLEQGDTLIDGGNTKYTEAKTRAILLAGKGVNFLDVGVSGGIDGARTGACLMAGGDRKIFERYEDLFRDLAAPGAYGFFGSHGAGHFVKMVHNGIEYGFMQALGEGFEVLKKSEFELDLKQVANVYNNHSIIESHLVGWLEAGFEKYGTELENFSGRVAHTGEGLWTVEAAQKLGVPTPIIKGSLKFREDSQVHPSYTGKILSVLRNMFGGHIEQKQR